MNDGLDIPQLHGEPLEYLRKVEERLDANAMIEQGLVSLPDADADAADASPRTRRGGHEHEHEHDGEDAEDDKTPEAILALAFQDNEEKQNRTTKHTLTSAVMGGPGA